MAVIPKDQLAAYERWQFDRFDSPEPVSDQATDPEPLSSSSDEGGELVTERVTLPTADDIERIHNEAHQEGYDIGHEAGFAEGRAAGMAAIEPQVELIGKLLKNMEEALAGLDQQVANALLDLAMETARQVVRSTIQQQPEIILPVIREAITALPLHHGTITLHLHPDDATLIREHLGDQLANNGWHLIEDADIEAGGCQLKAGASEVDATLQTRWQRVLEAIGAPASTASSATSPAAPTAPAPAAADER